MAGPSTCWQPSCQRPPSPVCDTASPPSVPAQRARGLGAAEWQPGLTQTTCSGAWREGLGPASGSACLPGAHWPRPQGQTPVGKMENGRPHRTRWEIPCLKVMKLDLQELVCPPRPPVSLGPPASPVPSITAAWLTPPCAPPSPGCSHPNLREKLTGPSAKVPCSSLCCSDRGYKDKKL